MIELSNTPKAVVTSVTLRIEPELSKNTLLPAFYESVAASLGIYADNLRYDCTKIDVSLNIQTNMFETFERRYPGDSVGMYWAIRGPKTERTLPDDTVVLSDGYITDENEKPLPLMVALENDGEENRNGEL